ncbi:hypothetical protein JCM14469_15770 [Desulfatiferula olefinivorans]
MSIPHDPWVMPCGEHSDRVVKCFEHDEKEAGLFSVTAWDAHRSVAVRHAPACPAFSVSPCLCESG